MGARHTLCHTLSHLQLPQCTQAKRHYTLSGPPQTWSLAHRLRQRPSDLKTLKF